MNKPDWSTETLVRLEASSPAAKGGREKSTNSRKRVQGRGWHRRNAPGSLGPWWGGTNQHKDL